jgi:hypothetical protein
MRRCICRTNAIIEIVIKTSTAAVQLVQTCHKSSFSALLNQNQNRLTVIETPTHLGAAADVAPIIFWKKGINLGTADEKLATDACCYDY